MAAVHFGSASDIQALLRAAVIFKFDGGDDAEIYLGSPQYARALRALLAAVVAESESSGKTGVAERWQSTYRLAGHQERWRKVADSMRQHPKWRSMDAVECREWVDVLASPYSLHDDEYAELLDTSATRAK